MNKLWLCVLALASSATLAAPAMLVTGDYPPFVIEQGANHGVVADLVTAAFAASGETVQLSFLPWKRGYLLAERGDFIGTFPYAKNPEREAEFFYSAPLYTDRISLFVAADTPPIRDWQNKTACIPIGFDLSQLAAWSAPRQIHFEHPPNLDNCFNMLANHRVDTVPLSELVGRAAVQRLFGNDKVIQVLEEPVATDITYLIISRKLPRAADWLARFNKGLAQIRKNGEYDRLIKAAR